MKALTPPGQEKKMGSVEDAASITEPGAGRLGTVGQANLHAELEERLRFETLLADFSSRFINLSAGQISVHINEALGSVAGFLGFNLAAISKFTGRATEGVVSHIWTAPELPPIPPGFTELDFPWKARLLTAGNDFQASTLDVLPPEAARDRATYERFGVQSVYDWCLRSGGAVIGCFSLASVGQPRAFPGPFREGLQFFAQILANALARERAELELRASEERLNLAADAAGAGLWIMTLATERVWVTPRLRDLFQFAPEEDLTYERFLEVIHPEDRELVRRGVTRSIEEGVSLNLEFRLALPGGQVRWVSARGRVRCNAAGQPDYLMGASVDITERKHAEAALRERADEFRALITTTADGFWVVDATGRILEANEECCRLYGYSRDELLTLSIKDFEATRNPAETLAHIEEILKLGFSRFETRHHRKDGEVIDVEVSTTYRQSSGTFLTFIRDITARKRAQDALRQSFVEIERLKDRLEAERDYLKAEIKVTQTHGEFIGRSPAMRRVLGQVEQVAPTDSSVLIHGETGTGKERIAEAIHRLSPRRGHVMVKVNCAALPSALVESELFGREKGAFTGALTRQVGRFEVADGSTIFLDEIGELSLEVQGKLLRVLQEGRFERLGSPKTIRVNVRVIAATNRDLGEEIRKGRFREDLYYRLNVFPIHVPPLRERAEDIPLLVWTFLEEFSARMGKRITQVPRKTMEALQRQPWPGNVRQLRNVIEHGAIVTTGRTLVVPMLEAVTTAAPASSTPQTLAESERQHILKILEATEWRIKGPKGAAASLGLHPSTLYGRMHKLGIPNHRRRDNPTG